jgi:hypothetical protein
MPMTQKYLVAGLAVGAGVFVAVAGAIVLAPSAAADCNSSGYATVCAQGDVRGGSGGGGASSGPYYPYPCEDDWACGDGELSVILDPPDIGGPPIWGPGRPGGPGGPGGPGRPGGIGRG